jgi:hypothetical protein
MKISAIDFDPGGEPEHPMTGYERVLFMVPGRIMTGGREMQGDCAVSCEILTMVIRILSRRFSAIKPRQILQPWKRTRGIRFPCLVGRRESCPGTERKTLTGKGIRSGIITG